MFKRIYPLIIFFNLITALAWAAPDGVKQNLSVNSTTELAELDTGGGTTWEELEDGDICWVISATGLSFRIYIYDSDSAQTEDGERYVTPDESSTGVAYSGDARWVCMSTAQAGSDGDYFLELGNNTAIDPDASKYQVYFDAGELKVNENGTEKYIANLTDAQTFAGALTLTGGITSIGSASNLSGGTVTLGTLAGTINLSSGTLGASGTGAITASDFALTADADAGDYDILSLDRLEGIDATEFIDLGADGYVVVDAGTAINLDSSVQAGDGTYSWDHTPAFGIEGILEVDGAAYLDGGLTSGGAVALGANNLTMTGSLAATGSRVTKGWFTDIESTNMPTVGGTALFSAIPATLANAAASTWTVVDNNASGLSIGSTGKADIFKVVSTDAAEGVTMSGTLGVTGTTTLTGGITFGTALVPASADALNIGSATAEVANLYLGDSAVIYGQNDQSNTLTSSATGWTMNLDLTISGGNINFGNIAGVLGDAATDSITLTTDGTGTGEVVLPNDAIGDAEIDWGSGAGQIDLADIPGGAAGASAFDFGGATSLEIPNWADSGTLDATGEIGISRNHDTLSWYDEDGGEISGEVSISPIQHKTWSFDPKAVCDGAVDSLFLMTVGDEAPHGIIIDEWKISFEADPTTEIDADLCYADAYIGKANEAIIDALDTTTGAATEDTDANINSGAAVANGKVMYLDINTAYTETNHQVIFEIWYHVEED